MVNNIPHRVLLMNLCVRRFFPPFAAHWNQLGNFWKYFGPVLRSSDLVYLRCLYTLKVPQLILKSSQDSDVFIPRWSCWFFCSLSQCPQVSPYMEQGTSVPLTLVLCPLTTPSVHPCSCLNLVGSVSVELDWKLLAFLGHLPWCITLQLDAVVTRKYCFPVLHSQCWCGYPFNKEWERESRRDGKGIHTELPHAEHMFCALSSTLMLGLFPIYSSSGRVVSTLSDLGSL